MFISNHEGNIMKSYISKLFMLTVFSLSISFSQDSTQVENNNALTPLNPNWKHYVSTDISIINGKNYSLTYGYTPKDIELTIFFSTRFDEDDQFTETRYDQYFQGWETFFDGQDSIYIPVFGEHLTEYSSEDGPDFDRNARIHITKKFQIKSLGEKGITPYFKFRYTHIKSIRNRNTNRITSEYLDHQEREINGLDFALGLKSEMQIFQNLFIEFDYSLILTFGETKSIDTYARYNDFPDYYPIPIEYFDEVYLSDFNKRSMSRNFVEFKTRPLLLLLKYYF